MLENNCFVLEYYYSFTITKSEVYLNPSCKNWSFIVVKNNDDYGIKISSILHQLDEI